MVLPSYLQDAMPQPTIRLAADHPSWDDFLADLARRWGTAVPVRKQDRSRRRQEDILQAALRVFARDGIARARISDVAAEAGMPVSSIYEYYQEQGGARLCGPPHQDR